MAELKEGQGEKKGLPCKEKINPMSKIIQLSLKLDNRITH